MTTQALNQHIAFLGLWWATTSLQERGINYRHDRHDINCNLVLDDGTRVKVKGARWTGHKRSKGRYQFNTRRKPDAFVLVCIGSGGHAYVIPGEMVSDRANIAIWSEDPTEYDGIWAPFLDAWWILDGHR